MVRIADAINDPLVREGRSRATEQRNAVRVIYKRQMGHAKEHGQEDCVHTNQKKQGPPKTSYSADDAGSHLCIRVRTYTAVWQECGERGIYGITNYVVHGITWESKLSQES